MSDCLQSFSDYGLRSLGYGLRALPQSDISFCDQLALIGGGMIWNVYFAVLAVIAGFCFATLLALALASPKKYLRSPASWFVLIFRGTPLFIQFFFAYELFVLLPKLDFAIDLGLLQLSENSRMLSRAAFGALMVLFLNTSAYSAQIFYGAYTTVPRADTETALAYGMGYWQAFRKVQWPTMLRLSWPSYTNEAIFLFHATTLVFFSSFPAWRQEGDAFYYANYLAEKTFNPFVPYPIIAAYFIAITLLIIAIFGLVNKRLNRHLHPRARSKIKYRPNLLR